MNQSSNTNKVLGAVAIGAAVALIVAGLIKLFKDYAEDKDEQLISDEGKDILNDPKRKKNLEKAIQHYKEEGNWDLLEKV